MGMIVGGQEPAAGPDYSVVGVTPIGFVTGSIANIDMPAGIQAGDLGFIGLLAISQDFTAAGWTVDTLAVSTTRQSTLRKTLAGTETNVVLSGASVSGHMKGALAIRGPTVATQVTSNVNVNASGFTEAPGFAKAGGSKALLVIAFSRSSGGSSVVTPPAGFTVLDTLTTGTYVGWFGIMDADAYTDNTPISITYAGSSGRNAIAVYELT